MSSKFNDTLEMIESLSLEEQEQILEIEKKRLAEKKRNLLLERINEGKKDIAEGKFTEGKAEDLMKAIEDEINSIQ